MPRDEQEDRSTCFLACSPVKMQKYQKVITPPIETPIICQIQIKPPIHQISLNPRFYQLAYNNG